MKSRIFVLILILVLVLVLVLSTFTLIYAEETENMDVDKKGDIEEKAKEIPIITPIVWNEKVKISSPYGYRIHPITEKKNFHTGVDISAPIGTPIFNVFDGVVVMAKNNGNAGNEIRINHGNGVITRYLHMYQRTINIGDKVEAGQFIGTVGATGRSTGAHLHFEIQINGKSVNPINIVLGIIK